MSIGEDIKALDYHTNHAIHNSLLSQFQSIPLSSSMNCQETKTLKQSNANYNPNISFWTFSWTWTQY